MKLLISMILFFSMFTLLRGETITLEQYLNKVKNNHPFFASKKLEPRVMDIEKEILTGDEDWQLSAGNEHTFQRSIKENSLSPERIFNNSFQAGLKRNIWDTGGSVYSVWELNHSNTAINENDFLTGKSERGNINFFQQKITVGYEQPLLKNFKGFLSKFEYILKDLEIDAQKIVITEEKEDYLLKAAVKFIQWSATIERERLYKERLSLAEELLIKNKAKYRDNLVDKIDLLRSQDEIIVLKQAIIAIKSEEINLMIELSHLANEPISKKLLPQFDLYKQSKLEDEDETIKILLKKSRVIASVNKQKEQLESTKHYYRESSKPDLNLKLTTSFAEGDEEFSKTAPWRPEVVIGLDFSMPLNDTANKNQLAKKTVELKILDLEIKNLELSLKSELMQYYSNHRELEKIIELDKNLIESGQKKTEELLKLYHQGRRDLFYVIQSRDDEVAAKLNYIENISSYQILKLQIKALMDELW